MFWRVKLLALIFLSILSTQNLLTAQDYAAYPLSIYNPTAYDIAADDRGNLHLLWMQGWTLYYGKLVFSGGGFIVSGQQTIASGNINNWYTMPRIAVKRDGSEVHIVWGRDELWHAWRDNTGVWTVQKIGNAVNHYKYEAPVCTVTNDGIVHVIYQWWNDYGEGVVPMPIMYVHKNGGKWSNPVQVSYNPRVSEYRDPHIFADSQGGLHATWRGFTSPSAEYRYASPGTRLDQGSFFFLPYASDVRHNAFGDIFVEGNGRVHRVIATWTNRNSVTIDHSWRTLGSGFSSPTRPSNGDCADDHDHWAAVAAGNDGRIYVAYYDRLNSGSQDFIISIWNGRNWDKRVVDNLAWANQSRKPAFAATYDNLFVIWASRRNGTPQLWIGVLNNIEDDNSQLNIVYPNGGEIFNPEQPVMIRWNYQELSGNVRLELYRGTVKIGNIASSIPLQQMSYQWTAGTYEAGVVAAGDSYRIRIVQVDGFKSDSSDNPFTIRGLDLQNPDGGEIWEQDKENTIIWRSYGVEGYLKISLLKGTQVLGTIADNVPANQNSFTWKTGTYSGGIAGEGDDYRIRIETSDRAFADSSSGYFRIKTNYIFQLLSPNGGEIWEQNSTQQIGWNFQNLTGNINIELFQYGVKIGTITSNIPISNKVFSWQVGKTLEGLAPAGGGYRIKIYTTDGRAAALSANDFIIAGIKIFNPQKDENWDSGRAYTIRWESFGYGGGIDIELLRNDQLIGKIAESIPASSQSFLWKVGQLIAKQAECGENYRIRIVSTNQQFQSEANGKFTINGFKFNAPTTEEKIVKSTSYRISWRVINYSGKITIYLLQNGRAVGIVAEKIDAASAEFLWKAGKIKTLGGLSATVARGHYQLAISSFDGRYFILSPTFFLE